MFRRLPAGRVKMNLSEGLDVETNLHFDTGFNRKFAFMTTQNVDSIMNAVGKPFTIQNKSTSLGGGREELYYTYADSIFIGTLKENHATDIVISSAFHMAMAGYGTSEWMALCGLGFMKEFKQVYFDLIDRYIYLRAL